VKLHQKISKQCLKASIHKDNLVNRRVEKDWSRGAGGAGEAGEEFLIFDK
jgi:hypothetical protein